MGSPAKPPAGPRVVPQSLQPRHCALLTRLHPAATETYTHDATRPDLVTLSNPFPPELRVAGGATTGSGIEVNDR